MSVWKDTHPVKYVSVMFVLMQTYFSCPMSESAAGMSAEASGAFAQAGSGQKAKGGRERGKQEGKGGMGQTAQRAGT